MVFGKNVKHLKIGNGVTIHRDVYIDVEEIEIADYVTIHHGSVLHGHRMAIGHNCWIGQYCILDSLGGKLTIGNNVGVGAQSQVWTHMKFGDRLAGNNFYKSWNAVIGDDVWLVGHCLFVTEKAEDKSMLMLGGMATKDMLNNRIYAGSPAVDVTSNFGHQFSPVLPSDVLNNWYNLLIQYTEQTGQETDFVFTHEDFVNAGTLNQNGSHFFPLQRCYIPTYQKREINLMKWLLYDKAKFIPLY